MNTVVRSGPAEIRERLTAPGFEKVGRLAGETGAGFKRRREMDQVSNLPDSNRKTHHERSRPLRYRTSAAQSLSGVQKCSYFENPSWLIPLAARDAPIAASICNRGDFDKDTVGETIERVRAQFAALIRAEPDEIAIVKNVSEGVNALVASLLWRAGDNAVICTDVDHPNCIYALYNMRDRYGVEVRAIPAEDFRMPVDKIIAAIDERTSRDRPVGASAPAADGSRKIGAPSRSGVLFSWTRTASRATGRRCREHRSLTSHSKYSVAHGFDFCTGHRKWASDAARLSALTASTRVLMRRFGGERYQLRPRPGGAISEL